MPVGADRRAGVRDPAREETNYEPMRLQFLTGRHRSAVWSARKRHGVSRQRRTDRLASNRR